MSELSPTPVTLADETTLKVGGPAQLWTVNDAAELATVVRYAQEHDSVVRVLGGGSNILAPDAGVNDVVVRLADQSLSVTEDGDTVLVTVGAGADLDATVATTVQNGWWGLENLSHIPGTVGATPVQNVGAYGVEVADVIESVAVFAVADQSVHTWSATDCDFGYRQSRFKTEPTGTYIILSVTFRLSSVPTPVLNYRDLATLFPEGSTDQVAIREAVIAIRSKKFPDWRTVGTAGSFFKNPIVSAEQYQALQKQYPELPGFELPDATVKLPLGYILDKILGLRGVREGAVGTYEHQALVVINHGGATASNVTDFVTRITDTVQQKLGLTIEWEVTRW